MMNDMRLAIIRMLLHWLIHNGSLPSVLRVHPRWVSSVEAFLADLDLAIAVRGDFGKGDDDVELEA